MLIAYGGGGVFCEGGAVKMLKFRLPSFCPARHLKVGEALVCPKLDAEGGCRRCMNDNIDVEVDPK
jgi:hypothetical protein